MPWNIYVGPVPRDDVRTALDAAEMEYEHGAIPTDEELGTLFDLVTEVVALRRGDLVNVSLSGTERPEDGEDMGAEVVTLSVATQDDADAALPEAPLDLSVGTTAAPAATGFPPQPPGNPFATLDDVDMDEVSAANEAANEATDTPG